MRPRRTDVLPTLLGLAMALPMVLPAAGQGPAWRDCPAIDIDERAFSAKERQLIREAATIVRAFLRSHGVDVQQTISVDAREPDGPARLPNIGAYALQNQTIAILTFEQAFRHALGSRPTCTSTLCRIRGTFIRGLLSGSIAPANPAME